MSYVSAQMHSKKKQHQNTVISIVYQLHEIMK